MGEIIDILGWLRSECLDSKKIREEAKKPEKMEKFGGNWERRQLISKCSKRVWILRKFAKKMQSKYREQ